MSEENEIELMSFTEDGQRWLQCKSCYEYKKVEENTKAITCSTCTLKKALALKPLDEFFAKKHNIPIIGQGGILTIEDAIEFIIAGSTAVGIGTALFYEPLVCAKLNKGISEYLGSNNLDNISDLIGTLDLNN